MDIDSKAQWKQIIGSRDGIDINKLVEETYEDGSTDSKMQYIDIRMGTKCQLACVMCSPHDSSGWVKDWNAIYPQIENKSLKETMIWSNKGKEFGANYNWHKNNQHFGNSFIDKSHILDSYILQAVNLQLLKNIIQY